MESKPMEKIKLTKTQLDKLIDYYYENESDGFVEQLFKLSYSKIKQIHALVGKMKKWDEDDAIDLLNYIILDRVSVNYINVFLEEHLHLDADLVRNIFKFCEDKKDIVEFIYSSLRLRWYLESMYWGTVFMLFIEQFSQESRRTILDFVSTISDVDTDPSKIAPWLFKFDFVED